MKEKMTNNLSLKIIAVLFAAGLWMISININDPYQSKDYSVVVQLQNMSAMTSTGKYVEVLNDSDEITVRVRGNRSVMDSFSASNIVATADLNEMDENNQVPIKLSTIKTSGSKIESLRSADSYVDVKVENIRRIQKKLEVVTKNPPEGGYILGKVSTEQNALRISGPESAIALVDKAVVNFDLANATDDVSMILPIELYDTDGNKINDHRLTMSINEVQCLATILATKEVPFEFATKGNAAKGYGFTGEIISEPSNVVIAAKSSLLRRMNKLEIADAIDIQGAKENVITTVDVREYLPENVIFADQTFGGNIKVTAVVEETFAKEVEIPKGQVQIVNVPERIKGEVAESKEEIVITVNGYGSEEADFDVKDVKAKVDILAYMNENNLIELQPGTYEMDVRFETPEGTWIKEEISVDVKISVK
ncbi:MAG: hypothetical protein IKL06_03800 [Lachnospiraceae bacterium]|nr:hypothetical protein [Lachnospiraceae bacterium]